MENMAGAFFAALLLASAYLLGGWFSDKDAFCRSVWAQSFLRWFFLPPKRP